MAELSIDYLETSVHEDLTKLNDLLHSMFLAQRQIRHLQETFITANVQAEKLADSLNLLVVWSEDQVPTLTRKPYVTANSQNEEDE